MLLARIRSSLEESQAWLTRKTLPVREALKGPKSPHGPPRGQELLLGQESSTQGRGPIACVGFCLPHAQCSAPESPAHPTYLTHQQAVSLGEGDSVADLGGPLMHMAWEQQLLSVSGKGVDSRGLGAWGREVGKVML